MLDRIVGERNQREAETTELKRDHEHLEQRSLRLFGRYTETARRLEKTGQELDRRMFRFDRMMGTAVTKGRIVVECQASSKALKTM